MPRIERLGIDVVTTCRASAKTCRTTWRSMSRPVARSRVNESLPEMVSQAAGRFAVDAVSHGPAATNHFEAGGFLRSNDDVPYPNLMFHFLPLAIRYDGSSPSSGHGYQVHVGPMYSNSRGSHQNHVAGSAREAEPAIQLPLDDRGPTRMGRGDPVRREILNQPALDEYNGGELSPGPAVNTPDEILDWVRRDAETALHPSCTCKMGTDEMAVVDPQTMAVRDVEGLKIVDASVMPYVTNGNIYAPVMMLAEKASDAILGHAPLPAEHVEYFVATPSGCES